MKKKFISFILAVVSSLTVSFYSPVYADTKPNDAKIVMVEGEAAIVESEDTAEKEAIATALRNAVEQETGVYIQSETKVKNFQTLSDEIYTKSQGYVSDYVILSKQKKKDSILVKIKATVSLEPLLDSLKKLGLLRKWTVAVILAKTNDTSGQNYSDSAITELNETVINNGFRVVDQDVIASLEKPEVLTQLNSGNYIAASKLLRDNGVDILVISKAYSEQIASYADNAYGVNVSLSSAKGRLETKVVRCDTAELLASKTFEGKAVGGGDVRANALKNSAEEAGNYLVGQIMKLPASTSSYIQLYVKNITFTKAKQLSETIKSVRGVRKVTSRGFRDKQAIYEVETDGDVNLLADNMAENAKLTKLFKFDISSVSSGKIEASVGN